MARAHAGKNAGRVFAEKAHALYIERSFADTGAFANGEDVPPYYRGAMTYMGGYHRRRAHAGPYGWAEALARGGGRRHD